MTVLTLITDPENFGYARLLKPSAELHQLKLVTLTADKYPNHRYRDVVLLDYLQNIDSEELLFYTDGYDAMFVAGEDEILSKFRKTGKELLFSAEYHCWPDYALKEKYPETKSHYKYLCGGGFIGKAGYIKKRIEDNLETESTKKFAFSNQIYWTEQFLRNQSEIGLDTNCEIFCTFASDAENNLKTKIESGEMTLDQYFALKAQWLHEAHIFKDKRIFVISTQSYPCHVHANGKAKMVAGEIIKGLEFSVDVP